MEGRPREHEPPPDCSPTSFALAFGLLPVLTLFVVLPTQYEGYWAARIAVMTLVVLVLGGVWIGRGERTWLRAIAVGAIGVVIAYGWVLATPRGRDEIVALGLVWGAPFLAGASVTLALVLNLFALALMAIGQRDRREWLERVKHGGHAGYRVVAYTAAHAKLPLFLRYRTHVGATLCRGDGGEPIARAPFV